MSEIRPGSPAAWMAAIRPKTLPVGLAPVVMGWAVAAAHGGGVNRPAVSIAAVTALLLQILSNLANDLFDFKKGADGPDRQGPVRAMAAGLLTRRQMTGGILLVAALALVSGSFLVVAGGWVFGVLGIAAVLCALAYTGGPFPLGYHGLGDLFVFLFFGPVAVCGTTFLAGGQVPPASWPCAVAVGCLSVNVLVVNNLRDAAQDALSGKRTLVVRFGRRAGIGQYAGNLSVSFASALVLPALDVPLTAILILVLVPSAVVMTRQLMRAKDGPSMNRLLASSARFVLVFVALLSAGMLTGTWCLLR